MSPTPPPVAGKYECGHNLTAAEGGTLGADVTVVVTVKDACSQAPGFIRALHDQVWTLVGEGLVGGGVGSWS